MVLKRKFRVTWCLCYIGYRSPSHFCPCIWTPSLKWTCFTCCTWGNECISPTLPPRAGCDSRSIFKQSKDGLNSVFFLFSSIGCLTKTKEFTLLYYLPVARERTDGFMPFPMPLIRSETQAVSTRVWTLVTNSISHYNNLYVKYGSLR